MTIVRGRIVIETGILVNRPSLLGAAMDKRALCQSVGIVLRAARVKAGISQETLAERAGVDRTFVGRIENGRQSPTLDTLAKIAEALGVRPSAVLRWAEDWLSAHDISDGEGQRSEGDSDGHPD